MKLSVPRRIFVALFVVGLLPFYLLLYYMYLHSSKQLVEKFRLAQQKRLEAVTIMVRQDIDVLRREAAFLASLPMMDDLVSDDIDRRIADLLALKQRVYKLHTELCVNDKNRIVARTEGYLPAEQEGVRFAHDVFASFDPDRKIGSLEILLPYAALNHYFTAREDHWCVRRDGRSVAGECLVTDGKALLFEGERVYGDLCVDLTIERERFEAPLRVLRQQLLAVALFSFAALVALFVFVTRIVAGPIAQNNRLQEQKLELLEASRQAAEAKSRFISQMSHEFRTPLNSIIGFSQFLDQEKLVDPEYAKLPKNIERSGKALLELVNQILDFAKAEQADLAIRPEPLHLERLIAEVVESLRPQASAKRLELAFVCDAVTLESDERLLRSILVNLVANGIKFTDAGYVRIEVRRGKTLEISVRDSGIGITPEQGRRLFQPFVRLESAVKTQGSGLGLALSAAYARRLGARLYLVPRERGSEFILEFNKEAA